MMTGIDKAVITTSSTYLANDQQTCVIDIVQNLLKKVV